MVAIALPSIDWASLILPFSYIAVVIGTFVVFSRVYRKRKAVQSANLQPWFPPHLQRDVYLSLLHMEPEGGSEKPEKKVPDSMLRAALLRRAVEDINRIVKIRTAKQACQSLLERGSVGDVLWQRFQRAEKEMEEELRDVVMEANALVPNWGQFIFQTANTIVNNEMIRKQLDATQAKADEEKAWAVSAGVAAAPTAAAQAEAAAAAPTSNGDAKDTTAPAALSPAPATATSSSRPSTPLSETSAAKTQSASSTPSKKKKGKK